MGILIWDAAKPEHLDAFGRYVELHRAGRIFAILVEGGTKVILRPRVQSRIDSAILSGLSPKTWEMLRESLDHNKLIVLEADKFEWAEDRALTSNGDSG